MRVGEHVEARLTDQLASDFRCSSMRRSYMHGSVMCNVSLPIVETRNPPQVLYVCCRRTRQCRTDARRPRTSSMRPFAFSST